MRRIINLTIWGHEAIPLDEWKYRNLKRILLPIVDVLLIIAGVSGALTTISAISEFFPPPIVRLMGEALAALGFACLAGVVIPRLWLMEMIAKLMTVGVLVSYLGALGLLSITAPDTGRLFVAMFVAITIGLLLWRISVLAGEANDRRARILLARQRGREGAP